ncbi:BQ2448_4117 [Microbotryum intermedium]|uniref:Threonylcarbamoyl-AMP synthase n=1 Tax=Microbotryum intermedium TaxID=269621 RepID=A0A238FFJ6_9BASI|nr:BQ2448_4117 [Microbotryum intermedium]
MQRTLARLLRTMSSPLNSISGPASSSSSSASNAAMAAATTSYIAPATAPILSSSSSTAIHEAASILRSGGLVAFPTETVYGLGASALSSSAVRSIYTAKGRPSDNPLIVHVSSHKMMLDLLPGAEKAIPAIYRPLMQKFWPGSLTLIFPLEEEVHRSPTNRVAQEVTAGQSSLALRMPSHPLALRLIQEADRPLAAPSANLSSRPSPTSAKHVEFDLGKGRGLGAILDGGDCTVGVESTVVDWVRSRGKGGEGEEGAGELRILRAGGVTAEEIEECLEQAGFGLGMKGKGKGKENGKGGIQVYARDFKNSELEAKPTTPGMKYKHYAPTHSKVVLIRFSSSEEAFGLDNLTKRIREQGPDRRVERIGLMLCSDSMERLSPTTIQELSSSCSLVTLEATRRSTTPSINGDGMPAPKFYSYPLGSRSRPIEAGQRLFAGLRYLDALPANDLASEQSGEGVDAKTIGVDLILIEAIEETGVGLAVMERARKSAGGTEVVEVRG